ncbi:hypothetical protein ABZU32_04475 [Sphaerisporangium sp. NPDC005288]|uniref:hypothetical protein n=1 Tax=unclassified Sphaerisporangium TaxID=2630420 RepID=UPI0033B5C5D3
MAGILLLTTAVSLCGLAWALFDAGRPGAPLSPHLRPDYGFDSDVTIYLPREAKLTESSLNVSYEKSQEPGHQDEWTQSLALYWDTARANPFPVILEFRGGARIDRPRIGETKLQSVELGDRQLVLLDDSRRLTGEMRIPPISAENSRIAFASPQVGSQMQCTGLAAATHNGNLSGLTFAEWDRISSACDFTDFKRYTQMVLILDEAPLRVDYLSVEPVEAGNTPGFSWKSEGELATLQVRASYVDVNGEAIAQRMLFLSGVVIGLAAACAPNAIHSISTYIHRRHRA